MPKKEITSPQPTPQAQSLQGSDQALSDRAQMIQYQQAMLQHPIEQARQRELGIFPSNPVRTLDKKITQARLEEREAYQYLESTKQHAYKDPSSRYYAAQQHHVAVMSSLRKLEQRYTSLQLMLIEQQNHKRLLVARQEDDQKLRLGI